MATSSILGGHRAPLRPAGTDTGALGPSDSSDSGSDVQGELGFEALDAGEIGGDRVDLASDTDAAGTGERGAAVHDTDIVDGADIAPDHITGPGPGDETSDLELAGEVDVDTLAVDEDDESDDDENVD